jgi:release factor glutamine methyltransferase
MAGVRRREGAAVMSEVRRGKPPWPADNSEAIVKEWLRARLQTLEPEERDGMARWLLEHVSGKSRGQRITERHRWSESALDRLAVQADRLAEGEPIQHVLGEAWFDGLALAVSPKVLIPRPETEELVVAMAKKVPEHGRDGLPPLVLDWCSGSGCIALSMKKRSPHAKVMGLEISQDAVELARGNAMRHGLDVTFEVQDLFGPTKGPRPVASVVVSNPPYIPSAEAADMHPRVVGHEPHLALFVPDDDALKFYRALWSWSLQGGLEEGGWLGMECHVDHALNIGRIWTGMDGWQNVEILYDMQGQPRHALGQRSVSL